MLELFKEVLEVLMFLRGDGEAPLFVIFASLVLIFVCRFLIVVEICLLLLLLLAKDVLLSLRIQIITKITVKVHLSIILHPRWQFPFSLLIVQKIHFSVLINLPQRIQCVAQSSRTIVIGLLALLTNHFLKLLGILHFAEPTSVRLFLQGIPTLHFIDYAFHVRYFFLRLIQDSIIIFFIFQQGNLFFIVFELFRKSQVLLIIHLPKERCLAAARTYRRQSTCSFTVQSLLKLQILQSIGRSLLFRETSWHLFFQLARLGIDLLHCPFDQRLQSDFCNKDTYNWVFTMNKIVNQRYSSDYQLTHKKSSLSPISSLPKHKKSHAAADLLHKQSQIELVKKRISALCIRDQKYTHKTVNADQQMERKASAQMQSIKIQRLLQQQRQRQAKQLQILKHRNLKTRADNYYRTKALKEKRIEEIKQKSVIIRSRSRDNHSTISQNKAENISVKKGKCQNIYFSEKKGQESRSRVLMNRREQVINQELREQEHLHKLQSIKDYQLRQLGKLQLMMVEKSNTSRAAYEATRDRLNSRTSRSRFQTHQIIRTARERKPSKHNISLNFY